MLMLGICFVGAGVVLIAVTVGIWLYAARSIADALDQTPEF